MPVTWPNFDELLAAAPQLQGQRVGVIISGGNVDLARYAQLLSEPRPSAPAETRSTHQAH